MKENFVCLGIGGSHNGSVALVINRELRGFIETERLTRRRRDRGVTREAINYVLDKNNLTIKDVDLCGVVSWFSDRDSSGKELFDKQKEGLSLTQNNATEFSLQDFVNFSNNTNQMVANGLYQMHFDDVTIPAMVVDHHAAHNFAGFYLSPFAEAICFSFDFLDNINTNHAVYYINDEEHFFRLIRRGMDFPIVSFYGKICDTMGWYPSLEGCGKIMAIAPYGDKLFDNEENRKIVEELSFPNVNQMGDLFHGDQYLHLLYRLGIKKIPERQVYYPQLKGEGGVVDSNWFKKEEWQKELNLKIIWFTQKIFEKSLENFVDKIIKDLGNTSKNVVFSGGGALNCVAMGKILKKYGGDFNLYIPPTPGDENLSSGAALFLANHITKNKNNELTSVIAKKTKVYSSYATTCFQGKIYNEKEINKTLNEFSEKINFAKYEDEEKIINILIEKLINNDIIAIFRDGSEGGARALCHRSLLAQATNKEMKNRLNKTKLRELFRPCSPVVLLKYAHEWFDFPDNFESPFMAFSVSCLQPEKVPSALHLDNSARIQTVTPVTEIFLDKLLTEYYHRTNIPVLINTSFNQQTPIVETPKEAIETFLKMEEVKFLLLQNYLVEKK